MARLSNTDATLCTPRMLPWRDWGEWHTVKALLFSPEPHLRCQGVQHVAVWRSRERIPHAVDTTSQLVEVRLNDIGQGGWGVACLRRSEEELRLVYSTVVVRAVNGLTGHEQKTVHAAPVSSLAREIGLPTWLVDIRHEAAHKQLPGLVILRLAADFLMDYLWRRYWAPQEEHLRFLWGAFDQLICRYKAVSESDPAIPCTCIVSNDGSRARPNSSHSPPSIDDANRSSPSTSKKRCQGDSQHTLSSDSASTDFQLLASPAGVAAAAGAPSTTEAPSTPSQNSKYCSMPQPRPATQSAESSMSQPTVSAPIARCGATSMGSTHKTGGGVERFAGAAETAAREIACSVTPTALSWAIVSLLADGSVSLGTGGVEDDDGIAGQGRRDQGHLLPRSKEKYPTPGTPGVDNDKLCNRLTTRWATLLDMFHGRWRGFGAALLVRLVETLLANASRQATSIVNPAASVIGPDDGPSTRATRCRPPEGGTRNGTTIGWERQAVFIGLWVRHLLSRRWHLRSTEAKIKETLRNSAVEDGLTPDFCDRPEASWGYEEKAWADRTAPTEVLYLAAFPLNELSARCRSALSALITTRSTSIDNESSHSIEATISSRCAKPHGAHWALPGLEAVVRCMDSALGKNGTVAYTDRHRRHPTTSSDKKFVHTRGVAEVGPTAARDAELQVGVLETSARQIGALPHKKDKVMDEGSLTEGEAVSEEGSQGGDVEGACFGCVNRAEAGTVAMMDLDALEKILSGGGPTEVGSTALSAAASTISYEGTEAVGEVNRKGRSELPSVLMEGHDRVKASTARESTVNVSGNHGNGNGGAWEMVENWTPCAIGTLPGWSGAYLYA